MGKRESAALLALAVAGSTGPANADTRLTGPELRWIDAARPVVAYARGLGLPLDIVVQPQPAAGLAPVAMAFVAGRCKLVFSMRGNPAADETDARLRGALFEPVAQAIVAHEMAHCWRHAQGAWHTAPVGFTAPGPVTAGEGDLSSRWEAMQDTRREEGFADLVGLAWTARQHPQAYAAVHAWFTHERADPPLEGSHHDTRAWIRRVADGRFPAGATPFEEAAAPWAAGLGEGR